MTRTYTNRTYLDALSQRVMIFDGAMGTNLQLQNLTAKEFGGERTVGCNDYLVLTYPKAVEIVHRSFLEAGVDVIETCSFRSNRRTLGEYGLAEKVTEINRAAASLARRLVDEFSTAQQPRFVAGSIGPSGKLPSMNDPELSNVTVEELIDVFREQARGLIEGGADLLLIETSQDILEVKSIILGIHAAFKETGMSLPIQTQVTLDTTGRMLLGTDIGAVLAILEGLPIDVIGLNCSTGPEHMREPIAYLGSHSSLPVSCIPNAGLPLNIDGKAVYPLTPDEFTASLKEFIEKYHVNVVGGCCGTTPAHLKALVQAVQGRSQAPRPSHQVPYLASGIQAQPMHQEPRPFLIGERLNTQGSAKFKQLIIDQNFDGLLPIARQQINAGAHGLDLCVALTERQDEAASIQKAIRALTAIIRVPLIIDATEIEVIETALKNNPGRCLINSTNLEAGREKADRIFSLAKKYNAAVIGLTIDEKGMAKTAERKLEIAQRLHKIAVQDHGLRSCDLVIDALTFTLATGTPEYTDSAVQTLEGIRRIKQNLPECLTSLGVSNCSFGLSPEARAVINSVMLYHAVQVGLDMAIVNPAQIVPYVDISTDERKLAEDLIFNRGVNPLHELISHFKTITGTSGKPDGEKDLLKKMTPAERLHWAILHRQKDTVERDIESILETQPSKSDAAVNILNTILLPAMKEVGDRFSTGELILPFVLQSAEVMKSAVAYLERYLQKKEGLSKGTLVLATVYGDVHDIGKNLVKTILSNNGYTVIDLGKQVPAETIISKAVENNASAIGLSALLVSTSAQMPLIVNDLQRRNLEIPVLVGGAAINRRFGRRILFTESKSEYEAGVYYCKDAFEGLAVMDELTDPARRILFQEKIREEARIEREKEPAQTRSASSITRSAIQPASIIPTPPGWGPRVVREMPVEEVFQLLSREDLFRLSWGGKNKRGQEWEELKGEFEFRLEKMRTDVLKTRWLIPQAVYGYWPAQSQANDLVLYEPSSVAAGTPIELQRLHFPRQVGQDSLCLADYFSPTDSGRIDLVALQVVTVGAKATQAFDAASTQDEYSEAYFMHGLAVQMAEASAEYLHRFVRHELRLKTDQGKRYSWGYPSLPDVSEHAVIFRLLPAESELGMILTSAGQLVPEQSTAAIIVHHPAAKYFNIG